LPVRFQFRVTKYDPRFREQSGAYTRDDWTSVSDVGKSFGGVTLTAGDYKRVENAYASAVLAMLAEVGVEHLTVCGVEQDGDARAPFNENAVLPLARIADVARSVLREEYWCRLESPQAFVHFGYDYYMYVGLPEVPSRALAQARQLDLFVEELSPVRPARGRHRGALRPRSRSRPCA
jgi:hypothetical protein